MVALKIHLSGGNDFQEGAGNVYLLFPLALMVKIFLFFLVTNFFLHFSEKDIIY